MFVFYQLFLIAKSGTFLASGLMTYKRIQREERMTYSADNNNADETAVKAKLSMSKRASTGSVPPLGSSDLRFQLANTLQSTLDLRSTLSYFFEYADQLVKCSGLKYENPDKGISIHFGDDAKHSAQYNVSSEDDKLGELHFLRKNKFAETELAFIEMLIGVLFYPLRNALQYKDALESSLIDALTGLKNRLALNMYADREIKLAKRHKKAMALLVIDLDHFKRINDQYGHLAGDAVLKNSASLILEAVRETDQVFRYGGEEFVVLLNEADLDNALSSAERIRSKIETTEVVHGDDLISLTTSIGVSSVTLDDTFNTIFERADNALYTAKAQGRNQTVCSEDDRDRQIRKIA